MNADVQDAVWLAFSEDGSLQHWQREQFPGGTRYVADQSSWLPDRPGAHGRSLALTSDKKIKHAIREIQQEFVRKAWAITEELVQLYPEATGALHLASARIEQLFNFNHGKVRLRAAGWRVRLLCVLGFHRLIPMSWLTLDQSDRGLVCNRCYKHVAED